LRTDSTPSDGGERPRSDARVRLVALVILLGIGAVLGLVAVLAGGSDEPSSAPLRVELYPGTSGLELVVYVPDEHNLPEVAGDRSAVSVECTDANGTVLAKGRHRWPFTDTDNGTTEAHVHQPIPAKDVGNVARCRLADTAPALAGRVTAPR
jgi:hypothetical protein